VAPTIIHSATVGKHALALILLAACERPPEPTTSTPPISTHRFDGARARERVAELLTLPRALGDPARARSIDRLADLLRAAGATTVDRLEHTGADPQTGTRFAMTTLIGNVRPAAPRQFILASHFDVRPWAESDPDPARRDDPIPGANDGTSGVAVLLELAPLLRDQLPHDVGFSLILFDGEELGRPGVGPYCAGSHALADALRTAAIPGRPRRPLRRRPRHGRRPRPPIIKRAELAARRRRPRGSHLVDGTGRRLPQFVDARAPEPLIDDHVPLTGAGIPSILLIDYTYPPWHTHADTIDQLSADSLGAVGETLRLSLFSF
jgi:glutaminyl-peptide cyclotransferase